MPTQDELWQVIAGSTHGTLATVGRDGGPQLSNILYVPDAAARLVRISTTADRVKARNLSRDARAALYVVGVDFWPPERRDRASRPAPRPPGRQRWKRSLSHCRDCAARRSTAA